jgi:hypothetical protein
LAVLELMFAERSAVMMRTRVLSSD